MSPEQEEKYEEAKSFYRHKILDLIDKEGISSSRFTILEGLTKLRQLSNHPRMVDPTYTVNRANWKTCRTCWKMRFRRATSF